MKTGMMQNATKATYFNLNAVDEDGSSISTQVWSDTGEPTEAAQYVLDWHISGMADKAAGRNWNKPLSFVFIHIASTKETFQYDFAKAEDVRALEIMAMTQIISPVA